MRIINYLLFVILFCVSCKNEHKSVDDDKILEPIVMQGNAYGSTYSIQYYNDANLNKGISDLLNQFDDSVNTYKENSYLSYFNKSEKGSPGDDMLLEIITIAQEVNQSTQGYYEPSVEPLSELWGFGNKEMENIPDRKQIDSVMQFVGMQHVNLKKDSILKDDPRLKLSFNSMTGYINDKIAAYLNQNKVKNYLIEIGGEVYASGKKPNNTLWTIGIDEPNDNSNQRKILTAVTLDNEALATSGNYRKYHVNPETGEKTVHTINPITGEATASDILSATVIAPSCAKADAIATSLMAMGYEKAKAFIKNNPDLKFYIIRLDNNEIQQETFNGFELKQL
ncbi:FAD:protein FMN transferase [Flavobacteriaceae bacterium Ap0902]|nr:FAD:protein FMN transferase [Flavobacteriaceae bacterium Ap0902]